MGYNFDSQMPRGKNITVAELVKRHLRTKTGVRDSTRAGYRTVQRMLDKEPFGGKKISQVKVSDAKLFWIKRDFRWWRCIGNIDSIKGHLALCFGRAFFFFLMRKHEMWKSEWEIGELYAIIRRV